MGRGNERRWVLSEGGEKAPRMRLSEVKRDRFLEVLGQTANRRAAAKSIGVEPRLMDRRREFDPLLDRLWEEALDQAHRRLSGANGPFDCIGAREFNVIRRGRDGRLKLCASGSKRWNGQVEERFLAALAACGNMSAAARSVGFGESSVWQRRAKFPAFARRIEEMLEEAEVALELRIAFEAGAPSGPVDQEAARAEAAGLPEMGRKFDPDLAMRFLKWRAEKNRTGVAPSRGGRPQKAGTFEDAIALIDKKVQAYGKRREAEKLAAGWSKDEEGRMIPPGWVRVGGCEKAAGEEGAGGEEA